MSKPLYLRLALNLARSFLFWHRDTDIRFFIATDQAVNPEDVLPGVSFISLTPGDLPAGFSAKLYLDRMAPADRTLFIDADCLCFGRLDSVFDRFAGSTVGVIGSRISAGEWFGDVATLLPRFGLEHIPKFNGGMYYVERGERASAVYATARELEPSYDALGLRRLRGRPNDELLMALAMGIHGIESLPDDGTIMSDPDVYRGEIHVSVLRGRTRLTDVPALESRQGNSCPAATVHPVVVHFLGDYTDNWRYRAEVRKLAIAMVLGCPALFADILINVTFSSRQRALEVARNLVRPLYHQLFGPRPVKVSERI